MREASFTLSVYIQYFDTKLSHCINPCVTIVAVLKFDANIDAKYERDFIRGCRRFRAALSGFRTFYFKIDEVSSTN